MGSPVAMEEVVHSTQFKSSNGFSSSPLMNGAAAATENGIKMPNSEKKSCDFSDVQVEPLGEAEFIKAESDTPNHWLPLSSLDKFIFQIHIPAYFVFKSTPGFTFEETISHLKQSLAKVLVKYYPFAGRMRTNPETNAWEVECNNAGAIFKICKIDKDLKDIPYYDTNMAVKHLASNIIPAEEDGVPTLNIQVTRFNCGAITVGCSFHHQLGDAHAVGLFMLAWTYVASGKDVEGAKIEPIHDRSVIVPSTQENRPAAQSSAPPAVAGTGVSDGPKADTSAVEGFVFDPSAIAKLKTMAPGYTSFEAATAFIWRHITRSTSPATSAPPAADVVAKMVVMVDYRGRARSPRVPEGYCGNAALSVAVIMPRGIVVEGPLDVVAKSVHDAIARADANYYHAFFRYAAGRGPPKGESALAISSCSRMPLYHVDFGWGKPQFAIICLPPGHYVPEICVFLPTPDGVGFVAYLQLPINSLHALQEDPDFLDVVNKFIPTS